MAVIWRDAFFWASVAIWKEQKMSELKKLLKTRKIWWRNRQKKQTQMWMFIPQTPPNICMCVCRGRGEGVKEIAKIWRIRFRWSLLGSCWVRAKRFLTFLSALPDLTCNQDLCVFVHVFSYATFPVDNKE